MQGGGVKNKINGLIILYPSQKQKLCIFLCIYSFPTLSHIITYCIQHIVHDRLYGEAVEGYFEIEKCALDRQ